MIRYIATRCGYAEGNSTGCLVWEIESRGGFLTEQEAFRSFINFISKKYEEDFLLAQKALSCCNADNLKPNGICCRCKTRVRSQKFDKDSFQNWYSTLVEEPCHWFGEYEYLDCDLWNAWSFPREAVVGEFYRIGEYAEVVISEEVEKLLD